MTATLEDVSKRSGYSTATVCRVVNGADGVSAKVRASVNKALRDLKYVPRHTRPGHQQEQRHRSERLIEVIMHRRTAMEHLEVGVDGVGVGPVTPVESGTVLSRSWELSNDFYRGILDGILAELHALNGKALVQVATDLAAPELFSARDTGVTGTLLVGEDSPRLAHFIAAWKRPLVLVDILHAQGQHEQVTTDNAAGIGQAVGHLAQLGHRRVGFVSGISGATTDERREAFSFHAHRHGLRVSAAWQAMPYDSISGMTERIAELLSRSDRPTAVVCCNDFVALATIHAAERKGLKVPRDLSVVGFDDVMLAALTSPPLTTVRVQTAALGGMAVRLLLSRTARATPGCTVRVPTQLMIRGSTGAPAAS